MKKLIFGPLLEALRATVRVIKDFLNPCPPPVDPWERPHPRSSHHTLFL